MAHYAFLDENNTVVEVIVGVDETETMKYLSYYLEILAIPGRKDSKLVEIFQEYISYYEYVNVETLINRYKFSKN